MRIGVQLPLSGDRAAVGRAIKSGVEMAVEAVNREGGVGGVPVEVIYEDDQDTEQGAREALKKLVQDHRGGAVGGGLARGRRNRRDGSSGSGRAMRSWPIFSPDMPSEI